MTDKLTNRLQEYLTRQKVSFRQLQALDASDLAEILRNTYKDYSRTPHGALKKGIETGLYNFHFT